MALLPAEQADLFLPLFEGIGDARQWEGFLAALVVRTQARRAVMIVTPAMAAPGEAPLILQHAAARAAHDPSLTIEALAALGLQQLGALRAGRVYALDELLDHDDSARREQQRGKLAAQGIGFARAMRVAGDGAGEALVLLLREREDFAASAAALLSSAAPYLRAALRAGAVLAMERHARTMAEAALARLGIGQIALDAAARVIDADPLAEHHVEFVALPGARRRLLLPPAAAERLERACAAFAAAGDGPAPDPVLITSEGRAPLLLRPAPRLPAGQFPGNQPAAIASLRLPLREDERLGAMVLRELYQLSPREAALAQKLSRGEMIVEAGRDLRLTAETARNYSKRIYARTGTRGAPDLVRMILSGLAPLA
ncbi:helix-turn-helix transcriptional regulator [Erythrobacter oryzae]|uniref:helix-turn-helix transcriptional regulator n=1 Tax=Erythrobacter oryzae TaxID=3019556 RepID=UPI002553362B|nr:LuxR family transcriptional regulator [Erythrobacter sp. COR-2]